MRIVRELKNCRVETLRYSVGLYLYMNLHMRFLDTEMRYGEFRPKAKGHLLLNSKLNAQ